MANKDIALMAHLMRRAGFGATYDELEARAAKGYEATVEELVDPDAHGVSEYDELTLARYFPDMEVPSAPAMGTANFMYHLYTTPRPLVEKMTLFWHMVFATGNSKVDNPPEMLQQIEMFRQHGMGDYKELLVRVSQRPLHDILAGQQREPQARPQRELGPRASGAFLHGAGQLFRRRRQDGCPGLSPAGPSFPRFRAHPISATTGNSSTRRRTTTIVKRPSWATPAASTGRTS